MEDKLNPSTLFNYDTADVLQPCSLDPNEYFDDDNGFTSVRSIKELYQPAVNIVEWHNCNGYCFRKKRRKKGDEGNPPEVLNNMTVGIGRKK